MESDIRRLEPFFGKWYLDRWIGSGTFGDVYSIYHYENGVRLQAAMKVLRVPKSQDSIDRMRAEGMSDREIRACLEKQVEGLIHEVQIIQRFRGNDHIVCYMDHAVVEHKTRIQWDIFICMELLEPLEDYLKRINATEWDVLKMWYSICQALVVCHGNNIIHRDIKIDNILVSREGYYKLVDFGISKHIGADLARTLAGAYPYMAPEIPRLEPYDGQADIYSLGMVVYRLLNAGRIPFLPPYPNVFTQEQRERAIEMRIKGKQIPRIPGLRPELMNVLAKCLEYNPNKRYASSKELLQAISKLGKNSEKYKIPLFDAQKNWLPLPRKKGKSQYWLLILLAAVLLVGCAALFIYIMMG